MNKIVFADGSELDVNKVSSIYGVTFDTVDPAEIEKIMKSFTVENLKSFKIVNEDGSISSQGENFICNGVMERDGAYLPTEEENKTTTIMCRPLTSIEKMLMSAIADNEAIASAIEELAMMMVEG